MDRYLPETGKANAASKNFLVKSWTVEGCNAKKLTMRTLVGD
jgi:hypothetical protein